MLTNTFHVRFKKTYFAHPLSDHCNGDPIIDRILRVTKHTKQNAASVPTTFEGGQHRYLLLIIRRIMENIPGTIPFIKPIGPGVVITIDTTNAVTATEKVQ